MLSLFQKIKILQAMHNLSDSKIRDCIGKDRYYNIEKGKADLPLETAILIKNKPSECNTLVKTPAAHCCNSQRT